MYKYKDLCLKVITAREIKYTYAVPKRSGIAVVSAEGAILEMCDTPTEAQVRMRVIGDSLNV